MQSRKKIKYSIFLKLILLIIVFIVLVNVSIGFIIQFSFERKPQDFMNVYSRLLSDYIMEEVSSSPDTSKIKEIVYEANANVRFELPDFKWTTDNEMLTISELKKLRDFQEDEQKIMIRDKFRPYFINRYRDGYIIISPKPPREDINFEKAIYGIIILITVLTTLLYFSLRWIFGPIKKLSEAVSRISSGNFDTVININRNDEIGNLAKNIDEMRTNISGMIKAKESLLIDVSHELRSPLTRIKLANEFVEDDKIRARMRSDIKEMEILITELLETYRLDTASGKLHLEKIDIVKFVNEVVSKFGHVALNLKTSIEKKEVIIDKEKIEIALNNIIDNSIKYSNGKPVDVRISVNPDFLNETIISVKDYGKGIEEEELSNIFEPFYRIDKSRDKKISGFGLGLSIVKKILDLHNATIQISSKPSLGTEFKIILKDH